LGDRNTKYFQIVVKQRRARNKILHLKKIDWNNTKDLVEIENILVNHFKLSYEESTIAGFDCILEHLRFLPIPQLST